MEMDFAGGEYLELSPYEGRVSSEPVGLVHECLVDGHTMERVHN